MTRAVDLGPSTIEDWLAAPGRWTELINGHLIIREEAPAAVYGCVKADLWFLTKETLRSAERKDIHPGISVNVVISREQRAAVIPDVVILNTKPVGLLFTPDQVELAVEVWTPDELSGDRARKFDIYAEAGIRWFWSVELEGPVVEAFERREGRYECRTTLRGGTTGTITAAPGPMTFDPADLLP